MTPKKEQKEETVKCSLKLPRTIWRESKIRAMDEDRDWQDLVAEALKLYVEKVPLDRKRVSP